jgi:hypothetical protein
MQFHGHHMPELQESANEVESQARYPGEWGGDCHPH